MMSVDAQITREGTPMLALEVYVRLQQQASAAGKTARRESAALRKLNAKLAEAEGLTTLTPEQKDAIAKLRQLLSS